ncbi:ankyrin [Mytilinidion resinicola]|uniref:Ankyrin n=1 Tax=Mytilinidion resinicola TaxID=574789 RepID=A0A6A6Y088_9PEZI|nr:ankyrin [Mytilinidion resinicola]KAF2802236.1 ankyrin [Mytilinidion resinicola]
MPLHLACARSSLDVIKILVGTDDDTYVDHEMDGALFQTACFRKDDERSGVLTYLLETTEAIGRQSSDRWGSNIHTACLVADLNTVKSLLKRGADINSEDKTGQRPIHNALFRTRDFVKLLREEGRERGIELFLEDRMHRNAFHFAVGNGRLDLVKYIIEERPELATQGDCDGWTPLFWALRECLHWDTESSERSAIIKELKARGADVTIPDRGKVLDRVWTPYYVATYYGLPANIIELLDPPSQLVYETKKASLCDDSSFCDICLIGIVGLYYICIECSSFLVCFKCYGSRDIVHLEHRLAVTNEGEEYVSNEEESVDNDTDDADEALLSSSSEEGIGMGDDTWEADSSGDDRESVVSGGIEKVAL